MNTTDLQTLLTTTVGANQPGEWMCDLEGNIRAYNTDIGKVAPSWAVIVCATMNAATRECAKASKATTTSTLDDIRARWSCRDDDGGCVDGLDSQAKASLLVQAIADIDTLIRAVDTWIANARASDKHNNEIHSRLALYERTQS